MKKPPRHPLDFGPPLTKQEFDAWYDNRYGFGIPRWLLVLGLLAFFALCFVMEMHQ